MDAQIGPERLIIFGTKAQLTICSERIEGAIIGALSDPSRVARLKISGLSSHEQRLFSLSIGIGLFVTTLHDWGGGELWTSGLEETCRSAEIAALYPK